MSQWHIVTVKASPRKRSIIFEWRWDGIVIVGGDGDGNGRLLGGGGSLAPVAVGDGTGVAIVCTRQKDWVAEGILEKL